MNVGVSIEKANEDIFNIFAETINDGRLADSESTLVNSTDHFPSNMAATESIRLYLYQRGEQGYEIPDHGPEFVNCINNVQSLTVQRLERRRC